MKMLTLLCHSIVANNLIFMIADDLGGKRTNEPVHLTRPNMARIAQSAVEFTSAYSQYPICGPSRGSFLSGRTPEAMSWYSLNNPLFSANEHQTLPKFLGENDDTLSSKAFTLSNIYLIMLIFIITLWSNINV